MTRTGEEIKKLIADGTMKIEELDEASLSKLMNYETDLLCTGEGDIELIKKCSALLDEKRHTEEWMQKFDNALKTVSKGTAPERKKWGTGFKRLSTVAAAVALLIVAGTFIVSAYVIESIYNKEDSFVFLHGETGREYTSFKEMVKTEALDIMYPTKMPKGMDITSVTLEDKGGNRREIRIATSDKDTHIVIQIAMGQGQQIQGNIGTHVINGCNYYVFGDSSHYYAFCYYKNDYYSFQTKNYKDLMLIIENMEE